jgi:hypothetical protein
MLSFAYLHVRQNLKIEKKNIQVRLGRYSLAGSFGHTKQLIWKIHATIKKILYSAWEKMIKYGAGRRIDTHEKIGRGQPAPNVDNRFNRQGREEICG